jgi:hypothetical protein
MATESVHCVVELRRVTIASSTVALPEAGEAAYQDQQGAEGHFRAGKERAGTHGEMATMISGGDSGWGAAGSDGTASHRIGINMLAFIYLISLRLLV